MRTLAPTLCVLVLLASSAAAQYSCPETCNEQPDCHCASTNVPGGLDPKDTPLFIVLTNDDAINPQSQPAILNITERHTNKNGCKMPATWFVSTNFTDPGMVQQVYVKGHEIATHTIHHVANPGVDEIVGAKMWLNQTAMIPLEKLQGFRAPFLLFSDEQRTVLNKNGFRYDSSISEPYSSRSSTSPSATERLWPYTFDYGIAQDCTISTGSCDANETHPGLWEFPMWTIQDESGINLASMDPQGNNFDLYKLAFDQRYSGNRAPLGIYLHAGWLIAQPDHVDELNQFLEYAMGHDGVFLATISQVLDWVENPVPASQLNLTCTDESELLSQLPGGQLCVMPDGGCLYGTFNATTCICDCQNERVNTGGYCKDASGRCTVQKGYDFTSQTYTCPIDSPSNDPAKLVSPSAGAVSLTAPMCGHDLVTYQGLGVSGAGDNSELYAQAMKAIDGSCETCTQASIANGGSFFTINLNGQTDLTGVSILSDQDLNIAAILVGTDSTNNGLSNPTCAKGVKVPAKNATVIPCQASGSTITLVSADGMSLCDVYPVSSSGVLPNAAGSDGSAINSVLVQLDINGVTVTDFQDAQGGKALALCQEIIKISGDSNATCSVIQVEAFSRRRALLQAGVHVTAQVNTTNAETVLGVFNSGASVASALQPAGLSVNPSTVKASAVPNTGDSNAPSTPAPATSSNNSTTPASGSDSSTNSGPASTDSSTSSDGGSSAPIGAIVGGVVGGLAVIGIVVGVVVMRKRKAAALKVEGRSSSFNPSFDATPGVTATVTTDATTAKAKMAAADDGISPLGSGIASFQRPEQP